VDLQNGRPLLHILVDRPQVLGAAHHVARAAVYRSSPWRFSFLDVVMDVRRARRLATLATRRRVGSYFAREEVLERQV